jgi:hypothetical protein
MTNRAELLAIAKTHAIPGTKEIITAIEEAKGQLYLATWQLSVRAGSAASFKAEDSYEVAGSFVKEANDYEIAAAKLNTLFLTLACILEGASVDFRF